MLFAPFRKKADQLDFLNLALVVPGHGRNYLNPVSSSNRDTGITEGDRSCEGRGRQTGAIGV